ncbi:hypothetical protein BS47DRAFT_1294308 [Hydnum rufescens UP504]|uniref:Uncharacterized protein n=1 Tax=Hydnum rufescens UP504 TaxID=1448309 RepID=A0A9P6DXY9_9AGAM|nr:hypothetical protein BS47DRAFT_1294308 [Hydnum rufescens UP504]
MSLAQVAASFRGAMLPLPLFDSPALPSFNVLDLAGALRLSVAIRQLKRLNGGPAGEPKGAWMYDLWLTLIVVFGGEIMASVLLVTPPSFMLSPAVTLLFAASHTVANFLPFIPPISLETELPLSLLDAATRSLLVCDFATALVSSNTNEALRNSPAALLITSTLLGNGGFFVVNTFSMLSPTGWALAVPPELKPWGWTIMDLWVAPLCTAMYAITTHAQPVWAQLHAILLSQLRRFHVLSTGHRATPVIDVWTKEDGRALCFIVLVICFSLRALTKFSGAVALARLSLRRMRRQGRDAFRW